jgi:pantoate--beta-alanine ligase
MQLLTNILCLVNFNKTTMPIFYGKVALIDYLSNIKPLYPNWFCTYDGALHDGHLSLMQRSLAENATTVVIFLLIQRSSTIPNLLKYPRTLEEDLKIEALNPNIVARQQLKISMKESTITTI